MIPWLYSIANVLRKRHIYEPIEIFLLLKYSYVLPASRITVAVTVVAAGDCVTGALGAADRVGGQSGNIN